MGDIDLEASVVHVTKAYDENGKEVKAPKTRNGIRDVPIHPSVFPLLKAMRNRDKDDAAHMVPIMAQRSAFERARNFRAHMENAKVTRSRLTEVTPTTMPINFRSLREPNLKNDTKTSINWRPQRELNPCYRRERPVS